MSRKSSGFLSVLVIIAVLAVFIAGIAFLARKAYAQKEALVKAEIAALPAFSMADAEAEAAVELKTSVPVRPPGRTPEEIRGDAESQAQALAEEKFPKREETEKIGRIVEKYMEAKPGQSVEFQSKKSYLTIRGTYKGREGLFIVVDDQKYRISDIEDEFKYLFDFNVSEVKTQEKIKEFRNELKADRDKYLAEQKQKIEEKLFSESGYVKWLGGEWRALSEIFSESVDKKRSAFEEKRGERIKGIIRKHRLFGIYSIPAGEN